MASVTTLSASRGSLSASKRLTTVCTHWPPSPACGFTILRHTWATLALAAGLHPKVVQERLGHTSINTTMDVYSHAMPGMQSQAAEQVSAMIFGGGA
jgi:integrase